MSARHLLPAVIAAATVALPAPAFAAEGPGYGGTADRLTVQWTSASTTDTVDVSGVGFRAGSTVLVRVGAQPVRSTGADLDGELRLNVDLAAEQNGIAVIATGHSPTDTVLTLVGAVPPASEGTGAQDYAFWVLAAMGTFVTTGFAMRRLTRRRPVGTHRPGRHRMA